MERLLYIPLPGNVRMPVIYDDKHLIIVDKPKGWLLAPSHWVKTGRNLQQYLTNAIESGAPWSKRLHIKFLRFIHRLDADCTGLLLLAKHRLALRLFSNMFKTRKIRKLYLAIVLGKVALQQWNINVPLSIERGTKHIKAKVDYKRGKPALTYFWKVGTAFKLGAYTVSLVGAEPITGRTHQIRVHLSHCGHPIIGDVLYTSPSYGTIAQDLALRSIRCIFVHPLENRLIDIQASLEEFLKKFSVPQSIRDELMYFLQKWPQTKLV